MPSYSSDRFYKEWKYSVERDFISPSGETIKYAQDGFRTWGSEDYKIPFSTPPNGASVNCNGSLIAISAKEDIYIYNTTNFEEVLVCRGHISRVDSFAFQPSNPKVLVSSAQNNYAGSRRVDPTIILWNLDEQTENSTMKINDILEIATQATETIAKSLLQAKPKVELSAAEKENLTATLEPEISRLVKTHKIANERTLKGRLTGHFQSEIFSPSGSHLIYLPGRSPRTNDTDVWDIKIYSMSTHEDVFTLSGHTDALMWTGYSPDGNMIGTVAWDESIRIWDANTGIQKYKFTTPSQNWTGGFSPDSQKFAGTCGDGSFYVYSLSDGAQLVHYKPSPRSGWMRALDWSPDCRTIAVGEGQGHNAGKFILYDVEKKEVMQERLLSTEACPGDKQHRQMMTGYLECRTVQFLDGGRKVLVLTSGDDGIETYNLETWEKWRFVRPGIDPEFEKRAEKSEEKLEEDVGKNQQETDDVLTHGGYSMVAWEDHVNGKIRMASVDGDAVRIWDIPISKGR